MKQPLTGTLRAIRIINAADASRINASDRHMLLTMLQWADTETLELRPAVETIAAAMGAHPQTVRRRLKRLEDQGVLVFVHRSKGGRCDTHRIRINLSALTAEEPMLLDVFGPATRPDRQASATDGHDHTLAPGEQNPRAARGFADSSRPETPAPDTKKPLRSAGGTDQGTRKQPPPPRSTLALPHLAATAIVAPGGGRGGEGQSQEAQSPPAAPSLRRVAEVEPKPTREAKPQPRPASVATNASASSPVVEALVALTVPRAQAERLANLPHVTLGLVAYIAAAAERQKPNRPARWIAALVERGPQHLEGWDRHQAQLAKRERELASWLIRQASLWLTDHAADAVYAPFCRAVREAIRPHFATWGEAALTGNLHPAVIRADASPIEVLTSLAASCGVELEIPTDTLRLPERDARTERRDGAHHAG